MKDLLNGFTVFARWTANASGNALTFIIALLVVIIWADRTSAAPPNPVNLNLGCG